jgi:nucleotidyltransferase substrate binding protein (TIGR01987 family)
MSDYSNAKLITFKKALQTFEQAFKKDPNPLEIDGSIKRFEYCFELSWKVMKIFLEEEGITGANSPKSVIKKSLVTGLVRDEMIWLDMLMDRNRSTHTYDESKAREIFQNLSRYYEEMQRIAIALDSND